MDQLDNIHTQAPRLLAYDRVDQNRRQARLLFAVFAVVILPAALVLALCLIYFFAVVVGMVFGVLTAGGVLAGHNWAAWAVVIVGLAVVLALLTPVVVFARAAQLILRLSGARPLPDDDRSEFRRTVENLGIASGLPQPRLYVVDSPAANAFSTGMSPDSSSVAVTAGALDLLDRRELEGILAHEMSQIANYDTRTGTILAAGVAFLRLPFTLVVSVFKFLFGIHWLVGGFFFLYLGLPFLVGIPMGFAAGFALLDDDPAQAAVLLVTLSLPVYAFLIAPLLGEVIRAAFSRERQFLADADAVLLARSAEPLATALIKMESAGMAGLGAARSTAHLWTIDPAPERPWWERLWPDYHPPAAERVDALARMGSGIPGSVLQSAADAGRAYRSYVPEGAQPSRRPISPGASVQPADGTRSADTEQVEAYRLTASETVVYEAPDSGSLEVDRLSAGTIVVVQEPAGDFLRVITPQDVFGYIKRLTPMVRHEAKA